MRAVLIDDEPSGLKSLELLIRKYTPQVRILAALSDPLEGVEVINREKPDLVFLDINMPNLNGFQLLDLVEFRYFHLVFTTAYREHGIKALRRNAIDYLLKPIAPEDLEDAVRRVESRRKELLTRAELLDFLQDEQPQAKSVHLPTKDGIEIIRPSSLVLLEAASNNSKAVLATGEVIYVTKPLKDFDSLLNRSRSPFLRIHKSYIINVDHVIKISRENGGFITMYTNVDIPISRQHKDELFDRLNMNRDGRDTSD